MTAPSDTHRRAAIRGREAVAQTRIRGAVWAARVFAILFGVVSIFPLFQGDHPNWVGAIVLILLGLTVLGLGELLRRGNRLAASLLLAAFVIAKLSSWFVAGEPLWHNVLATVLIGAALVNGVWGTVELAGVRRDAATIPPAPERTSASRAV
jgi:hypothetical protein